ncbi:MAG: ABC transporter permease [Phycisphaeraceae bacterium]
MTTTTASTTDLAATPPAAAPAAKAAKIWPPALTLWHRELVRFFRQKNRVVSALVTPVLFYLMMGAGLNSSFSNEAAIGSAADSVGYMVYFFPGTITMILLFTAIFSTITVIEDRREGFLQGVLVSPAPRLSIVLGKVLGGASIAMIHASVFLILWPFVASELNIGLMLAAIPVMVVLAIMLTAMGMCIAWPMDSTAGFHAVMMVLLMPMWFISGAIFPVGSAPIVMKVLMLCNPLTYGHEVLATVLTGGKASSGVPLPLWVCMLITLALTAGLVLLAAKQVAKPRKDGLA